MMSSTSSRCRRARTAVVTGASSGIGRAAARELAARGHHVFAAARRGDELELLRSEVGDALVPLVADVTDRDSVATLQRRVRDLTDGRGPDVLVNSAGFALIGPVETTSAEGVRAQFETNVFGLLNVTRAFLPAMRANRSGRVVNVSSIAGRMATPAAGVYSASKFAVEALSDVLRMELAPFGVHVALIEPSFVKTGIDEASQRAEAQFPASEDDGYEPLMAGVPAAMGRSLAQGLEPEQVARAIADAATSARPRDRYVVPAGAHVLLRLRTLVPSALADRARRRGAGYASALPSGR